MINTLSGNPRTQNIVDGLYNFVLNAAFSGAMSGGDAEGDGNNDASDVLQNIDIKDVKDGLNDVISVKKENYATEEEYKEELSNTIDTTIQETIGAELEDEVIDALENCRFFAKNMLFRMLDDTTITTTDGFKTWLSTHNTDVYYVLATPTYEEITDTTLLSQLEALAYSYEGTTNISQVNDDLPFVLDITALKEI